MRILKLIGEGIGGIVMFILRPRRHAPRAEPEPFTKIMDGTRELMKLVTGARSSLLKLQLDLEDYGVQSWEREKQAVEKYYRLVNDIFLLLDHLEDRAPAESKSEEADWLLTKMCCILEDGRIKEIPVKKGDDFNGKCHKCLDIRNDELPKDKILEVVRKGYFTEMQQGANIMILRAAEVIVSKGPAVEQRQSEVFKQPEASKQSEVSSQPGVSEQTEVSKEVKNE